MFNRILIAVGVATALVLTSMSGPVSAHGQSGGPFITNRFLIQNDHYQTCLVAGDGQPRLVTCDMSQVAQIWAAPDHFQAPSRLRSEATGLCLHEETFSTDSFTMVSCDIFAKQWYWDAANHTVVNKDDGADAAKGVCDPNAPPSGTDDRIGPVNEPPPGQRYPRCGENEYLVAYGDWHVSLGDLGVQGYHDDWNIVPIR